MGFTGMSGLIGGTSNTDVIEEIKALDGIRIN